MRAELLRQAQHDLPANSGDFALLVPYAVMLRYEDLSEDEPPACQPAWLVSVVEQTLAWASRCVEQKD